MIIDGRIRKGELKRYGEYMQSKYGEKLETIRIDRDAVILNGHIQVLRGETSEDTVK